ncbi:MAG: hypothetical protein AAGI34_01895 [Pseudomonadota bacterium]
MFTKFLNDEAGAVTIDWVALTAGLLLLGIAVVYGIFTTGVGDLTNDINASLVNVNPANGALTPPTQAGNFSGT